MYNPSVASNEMTMSRKMEFVKNDEGVSGPFSLITLSIPWNEKSLTLASLATVPVLSGLFFMSNEPIFAFSGVVDRFHHALSQSFFYRF